MPTSRAIRVTWSANDDSWSTIVFTVFFSCAISPETSTVTFCDRSPLATAVVTCAMFAHLSGEVPERRVDGVRQVLPGPGRARHLRLTAELALDADLARHAGDLGAEGRQLVDHRVDGVLQLQHLAGDVDRDLLRQVAAGHRRRHRARCPAPGR